MSGFAPPNSFSGNAGEEVGVPADGIIFARIRGTKLQLSG
jgi:hypothetical protein